MTMYAVRALLGYVLADILVTLGFIWALPGTLVGLLLLCFSGHKTWRRRGIVFEVQVERFPISLGMDVAARTFGCIIAHKKPMPDRTRRHETRHVIQWFILGPFFYLVYGACSFRAWARGDHYYVDNAMEQDAREAEGE